MKPVFDTAEYNVTEAAINEMAEYQNLKIIDPKSFGVVKKAKGQVTKLRTTIEATRKELKAPVLERGRLIDATAKELTTWEQAQDENAVFATNKIAQLESEKKEAALWATDQKELQKFLVKIESIKPPVFKSEYGQCLVNGLIADLLERVEYLKNPGRIL